MRRMSQCQRKRTQKPLDFAYAMKSFVGYLEGTEKALHTIRNYRSDLMSFEEFLEKGLGSKLVPMSRITRADLERYHSWLKAQGFKTNTRRRKLLTIRRLLRYLSRRGKLGIDVGDQLPAPPKMERVPKTFKTEGLLNALRALPTPTELEARNRILLWVLAETGCRVSEIGLLRAESVATRGSQAQLEFAGKFARTVPISAELASELKELSARAPAGRPVFSGFNRHGSLGAPISSRGVELLVKSYEGRLGVGDLTPRTFRHSAVLAWHRSGQPAQEIQRRLGLKTDYAFRIYAPLLKSSSGTTF